MYFIKYIIKIIPTMQSYILTQFSIVYVSTEPYNARAIWLPNPAANLIAYLQGYDPPLLNFKSFPRYGSISDKLAIGGTRPLFRTSVATTSSNDTPMGWPVKPFVLSSSKFFSSSPNTFRKAYIYGTNSKKFSNI